MKVPLASFQSPGHDKNHAFRHARFRLLHKVLRSSKVRFSIFLNQDNKISGIFCNGTKFQDHIYDIQFLPFSFTQNVWVFPIFFY